MRHRSRGKGGIILYPAHTHTGIGYAETRAFKAIHQDHGRVVPYRTIVISHRTIPRHTYICIRTKSNSEKERRRCTLADPCRTYITRAGDSKVTKAVSYSAVSHLRMSRA